MDSGQRQTPRVVCDVAKAVDHQHQVERRLANNVQDSVQEAISFGQMKNCGDEDDSSQEVW